MFTLVHLLGGLAVPPVARLSRYFAAVADKLVRRSGDGLHLTERALMPLAEVMEARCHPFRSWTSSVTRYSLPRHS